MPIRFTLTRSEYALSFTLCVTRRNARLDFLSRSKAYGQSRFKTFTSQERQSVDLGLGKIAVASGKYITLPLHSPKDSIVPWYTEHRARLISNWPDQTRCQ